MHEPDLAEQQILQQTRARALAPLDLRERRAELAVGGSAVGVIAALALLPAAGSWSPLAALVCAAALLATAAVRFDVGGGYTVPAQVAFVPLVFCVPAQVLPLIVACVLALGRVPSMLRGESSPRRLALSLGNAWFAIGAALYLVAVGGSNAIVERPALAVGLVLAQFAGDFLASALREAVARGASLREQLREAAWVYGVDLALTPAPLYIAARTGHPAAAVLVLVPVVGLLASFAAERRKRLDGMFELQAAYQGTALLLGDVVEADDGYTAEHCKDVVMLTQAVGRRLGLGAEQLRNLEFAALLHDVGKITVPKAIVNKPGPLDEDEWAVMRTHTAAGQRMLDRIGGFMADVGLIVRSHHERWDGTGYPDGLAGDAIPLEARIICACDAYHAMVTDRPYRAALHPEVAVAELCEMAGTQFDAAVVDAVLEVVEGHPGNSAGVRSEPPAPVPMVTVKGN
jgi:putative nucleotidyltransferase with HDIG domain